MRRFGYIIIFTLVTQALFPLMPKSVGALDEAASKVDVLVDCAELTEDEPAPDPGDVWPPDFIIDYPPLLPAPGYGPTWQLGHIDWKITSFDQLLDTMGFVQTKSQEPPSVQLRVSRHGVAQDNAVFLMGEPQNFRNDPNQLLYSWWQVRLNDDEEEVRYSLNGVAAGGLEFSEEPVAVTDTTPTNDTSPCARMTRTPDLDSDGDGMDDQWERRFSGELGGLVRSADDDEDGYDAGNFTSNETGESFRIAPNTISSTGANFVTGDGKFTNLEEYIWGTNPVDSDSDDDGFPDEADVAGVGQLTFTYNISSVTGSQLTYEVQIMGESQLSGTEDQIVTQIVGGRTSIGVVAKKNLSVLLNSNEVSPELQQPFQVEALTAGTSALPPQLEYVWDVSNGNKTIPVSAPNSEGVAPCLLMGFGNALSCTLSAADAAQGDTITFVVNVYDTLTGEHTENQLQVTLGSAVILTSKPVVVPQYPIDETGQTPVVRTGNESTGLRWVEVSATMSEGVPETFDFTWHLDEKRYDESCSREPLTYDTKTAPEPLELCGVGSDHFYFLADKENTHVYTVNVELVDTNRGTQYSTSTLKIYTDPTPTPFTPVGEVPLPTEDISLLSVANSAVATNEKVTIQAQNLEVNESHNYEYEWRVDGEVVESARNKRTLTFPASQGKTEYVVSLAIQEKEGSRVVKKQVAEASVPVIFQEKDNTSLTRLASVVESIRESKSPWAAALQIFVLATGILVVTGVIMAQRRQS